MTFHKWCGECHLCKPINNVVSLASARKKKLLSDVRAHASERLKTLNKFDLLEEMVQFQERRSKNGELNVEEALFGLALFELLEKNAETKELLVLTRSYRRHLEHELLRLRK